MCRIGCIMIYVSFPMPRNYTPQINFKIINETLSNFFLVFAYFFDEKYQPLKWRTEL